MVPLERPVMADPISVCNQALGELGSAFISSFTDQTSISTLCGTLYPDARDMTAELHPWNWCKKRVTLARLADAPAWGWQYQYTLPPDYLKVREVHPQHTPWDIEVNAQEVRVLVSNESQIGITYTFRVVDLNLWSPTALQVLVKVMASKLAKPITGQNSTEEQKLKEGLALLPEARASDGREGYPRRLALPNAMIVGRHRSASSGVWPYFTPHVP